MNGWRTQMSGEFERPVGVIGVVVAQKFPDLELIRVKLEEGFERVAPGTVWVMRDAERKGHAANFAWQAFRSNGIEPFLAPLVPFWKHEEKIDITQVVATGEVIDRGHPGYDLRAHMRDVEMRATCERIIVFHDKSSNITAEWGEYRENGLSIAKIYVIERGKKKTPVRRGRKPVGV